MSDYGRKQKIIEIGHDQNELGIKYDTINFDWEKAYEKKIEEWKRKHEEV